MNTKCVIFDMDGTLINSAFAMCVTINEMRKELNLAPNLDENFIIKTINNPKKNNLQEFFCINTINAEQKAMFERKFMQNYHLYAKPFDGAKNLLLWCKNSSFYVALASNSPQIALNEILRKNDILKYFDCVIGASDKVAQKPDPAMINIIKNRSKSTKFIFIGDSANDENAAINAKIPYINVAWGFGEDSTKFQNAKNMSELMQMIEKLI